MTCSTAGVKFLIDRAARGYCPLTLGCRGLTGRVSQMCLSLGLEPASCEFRVTTDGPMARLNSDFLGRQGPTNVLSFSEQTGCGSLVLNIQAVLREAWLYGQSPLEYWIRLAAHGLLHLSGFEHGPEMDSVLGELLDEPIVNQD